MRLRTCDPMGLPPLGSSFRMRSLSSCLPSTEVLVKILGTDVRDLRKDK
jgi:hypothetical protein